MKTPSVATDATNHSTPIARCTEFGTRSRYAWVVAMAPLTGRLRVRVTRSHRSRSDSVAGAAAFEALGDAAAVARSVIAGGGRRIGDASDNTTIAIMPLNQTHRTARLAARCASCAAIAARSTIALIASENTMPLVSAAHETPSAELITGSLHHLGTGAVPPAGPACAPAHRG